jgi:hypothetical protein
MGLGSRFTLDDEMSLWPSCLQFVVQALACLLGVARRLRRAVIKTGLVSLSVWLLTAAAQASVQVYVENVGGVAWLKYDCTAGEVVRAFALDITVDAGQIIGISNFFVGPSTAAAQGYGIFPASFRDHIKVRAGTNVSWDVPGYAPLAVPADSPDDTLPGLNSSGVTLEFGGAWDPDLPATVPGPAGTLCALYLSQAAQVLVAANRSRGGVVLAASDFVVAPVFGGTWVGSDVGIALADAVVTVTFHGGELETASDLAGPWTGTGNTSGTQTEPTGTTPSKFYRVRRR